MHSEVTARQVVSWRQMLRLVLALEVALFAIPATAYAYIDPGSGGLVLQALMAAVVGAAFYIRTIIRHVKKWVTSLRSRAANSE